MWYKISESLPDLPCHCLVYRDNGYSGTIEWAFFNSIKEFCGANSYLRNVTHWMPLPNPPAAEQGEGANLYPPTSQGQNGTAGKPQVGECTTSAIG